MSSSHALCKGKKVYVTRRKNLRFQTISCNMSKKKKKEDEGVWKLAEVGQI